MLFSVINISYLSLKMYSSVQINWLTTKKRKKIYFFNLFPFQSNNNYFQLEIRPPLSVINSITGFGIDSTSFLQFWVVSWLQYHTSIIASISLVLDVQSLFNGRIFTILHKFSIGFREGEFPGQSRTLMWFFSKVVFTFFQYGRDPNLAEKFLLRWEMLFSCLSPLYIELLQYICRHSSFLKQGKEIKHPTKATLWCRDSRVVIPSLNPIENLRSIVKIRPLKRDCTSKTKLIDAIIDVWYVTKKSLKTAKNS